MFTTAVLLLKLAKKLTLLLGNSMSTFEEPYIVVAIPTIANSYLS